MLINVISFKDLKKKKKKNERKSSNSKNVNNSKMFHQGKVWLSYENFPRKKVFHHDVLFDEVVLSIYFSYSS